MPAADRRLAAPPRRRVLLGGLAGLAAGAALPRAARAQPGCRGDKPLYLTFDTGHMGIATLVSDVLARQDVRVSFFVAAERTKEGGDSLDDRWAPWWRARAAEGHEFGSHTYQHAYWRGDLPGEPARFRIRPSAGPQAGIEQTWTAAQYVADIRRANERMAAITGRRSLPLYRAPGGKTSPRLLAAAREGGFAHVGWAPAGFLGDELPSDRYPNDRLLAQALARIGPGDILLAHLGIWSRQDPWAPAVLEPLLVGLKARGFCFRTLSQHPEYRRWIAQHA